MHDSIEDIVHCALSVVHCCKLDCDYDFSNCVIHIYLDGSYSSKHELCPASWAFVVLSESLGEYVYHGYLCGACTLNTLSPEFVGASAFSSISAELTAMAWALMWCIQYSWRCGLQRVSYHFHYDSTVSGGVAFALWECSGEGPLASLVQGLAYFLTHLANIQHSHVHAHVGHPWNSAADNLCEALRHVPLQGAIDVAAQGRGTPLSVWLSTGQKPHEWCHLLCDRTLLSCLPPYSVRDKGFLLLQSDFDAKISISSDKIAAFIDTAVDASRADDKIEMVSVGLLTANALTLKSLQETRDRTSRAFSKFGCEVFRSSADASGNFGCRIVFNTFTPFARLFKTKV
eukprot:10588958-Karenia_brevis.AAC.1